MGGPDGRQGARGGSHGANNWRTAADRDGWNSSAGRGRGTAGNGLVVMSSKTTAGRGKGSEAMQHSIALNYSIGATASTQALLELCRSESHAFSIVNCSTAFQRFAKLLACPDGEGHSGAASGELAKRTKAASKHLGRADGFSQLRDRARLCFAATEERVQPRHVCGLLWACAKLGLTPAPLLEAVLKRGTAMRAEWFKPQEISMGIWALGRLERSLPQSTKTMSAAFITFLFPAAVAQSAHFDAQGLANLVVGLSASNTLGPTDKHALSLLRCLRRRLRELRAQELANVVHGLAKMQLDLSHTPGLRGEAAAAIRRQMHAFSAQQLANVAWATAKLLQTSDDAHAGRGGHNGSDAENNGRGGNSAERNADAEGEDDASFEFWGLVAPHLAPRAAELNMQELSMTAWAAAQATAYWTPAVESTAKELTSSLALAAKSHAVEMDAQQLATVVLALAKLGCTRRKAFRRLARASRAIIPSFNAQDLDNLASGYARLGRWRSMKLLRAVCEAGSRLMDSETMSGGSVPARNVANLVFAVAKLKMQIDQRRRDGTGSQGAGVSEATDGFERADGYVDDDSLGKAVSTLSAAVERAVMRDVAKYNARDLANCAWGLAMLGAAHAHVLATMGAAAAAQLGTRAYQAMECSKLLYALGKAGVRCAPLEEAAAATRELRFSFVAAVGDVSLEHFMGGAQRRFWQREGTGAIAGNGGALWEDAYALAEWLSRQHRPSELATTLLPSAWRQRSRWEGVSAVELGAGLGLVAVVAARMGMAVTATDGDEETLSLLSKNLQRNAVGDGKTDVKPFAWGAADPIRTLGLSRAPDLILATGCVYGGDAGIWLDLIRSLDALSDSHTLILMAHGAGAPPGVHALRGSFYEAAANLFESARLPLHSVHADHRACQIHVMKRRHPRPASREEKEALDLNNRRGLKSKKSKARESLDSGKSLKRVKRSS